MTFDFRYPQLTGATEKEQIQQMRTYIHQLVDELKWALNSVDSPQNNVVVIRQNQRNANGGISTIGMDELDDDSVQAHFNEIKPLIIKSADIVNAYYDEINKRLEGLYVAQSDFGTFIEQTSQEIEANSTDITQVFNNVQTIATDVTNIGSSVQQIDNKVSTIDTKVSTVETKVSTMDSYATTMSAKVNRIDLEVSTIDTELKTVGENVGTLDTTLKAVEGNVGNLDATLKAVEGNVNTLDTNLKSVEGNVTNLDSSLKAVEGTVGGLDTNLKAVETDLNDTKVGIGSSLESISEEVGVIDKDLQGVKAGVEKDIGDLSDEVGKVDTKLEDAKSALNSDLGKLKDSLNELNSVVVEVNAHIKSGLLDYDNGIPVYGLEVGQMNTINGVETFNKYARFTAGRLSFYDNNGTEVAYISDYKLYITHAEVTGTLKLGGYLVDTSNGVTFKWVGRS